jgi:BirA family biotin operon repressor/biotin-[acetyl-CoA-carboxylase] ligase
MSGAGPVPPELRAELVQRLGAAGGAAPLARLLRDVGAVDADAAERALANLTAAELVTLDPDGTLRAGPRGSVLAADAVQRLRAGARYGSRVEVHAAVPSTNDVVLARAAEGAEPGLVVCAELQTAGRGRRGRSFDSPPGLGIWSTTLLDAPADAETSPRLSLVAALAVAEAVRAETGAAPALKWPNDVLVGGRKVCGILVEARTAGGRVFPVAGIGVNVHHRPDEFPPELRHRAASLESATGVRVERSRFLARLLGELESLLDEERRGTLEVPERFARLDVLRGRDVEVRTVDGTVRGRAAGVDVAGALLLDVPGDGRRTVRSGEVVAARERSERCC